VWLTVHRTSMWIKKPTRYHLVVYLLLLYKLVNMFRATLCPSSGADDLVVLFPHVVSCHGCVGSQIRLAGCLSIGKYVAQLSYVLPNGQTTSETDLTAYTATALHHTWKKSSAPEDGHKVARNMMSNL